MAMFHCFKQERGERVRVYTEQDPKDVRFRLSRLHRRESNCPGSTIPMLYY